MADFKPITIEDIERELSLEDMTQLVDGAQRYMDQRIERTTPLQPNDPDPNQTPS